MNKENLVYFENLFLELKKNLLSELKLQDEGRNFEKGDDIDQESLERTRALEFKLLGRQSFMLKKIDHALLKIKNGTYGICDECDGEIEINRLKARPVATQCILCKELEERSEDKILYEKKSHTHGKTMFNNVILMSSFREENNEQNNSSTLGIS
jgi:DnaK suppressor protein